MADAANDVQTRLAAVNERIETACRRAGRSTGEIRLIAVSKRIPLPQVVDACRAGHRDLGENRIQDALFRQQVLPDGLAAVGLPADQPIWHFIGHLQKNKVNKAVGAFALLHGVDSVALAEKIAARATALDLVQPILLEVNITGELQKHGMPPDEVDAAACHLAAVPGIELQGLMTMASYGVDNQQLHETFAGLRRLRDAAAASSGLPLPHLSMGMTSDFEIAIAEGATLIRVGTAIFGPRQG